MAGYGRPLKGSSRRVPITVHASVKTLDIIDTYVEEQSQQREGQYSRSDFWNEAATMYMKYLGIAPDDEKEEKRSKNVPEFSEDRNRENNTGNTGRKYQEK